MILVRLEAPLTKRMSRVLQPSASARAASAALVARPATAGAVTATTSASE